MNTAQFKIVCSIAAIVFLIVYGLSFWSVSYKRVDFKIHESGAKICENSTLLTPEDEVTCCSEELGTFKGEDGTFVINSQEEYDKLTQKIEKKSCKWKEGPSEIDFSKKTLLGQHLETSACASEPDIQIYTDFINKNIEYTLETPYCSSSVASVNTYWVLIPKVSSEYTVKFHTSTDLLSVVWWLPKGVISFFRGSLE